MNIRITILSIACLVLSVLAVRADSIALKATDGSYVYTVPHKGPVELGSVVFTLPADTTNQFTVSATRNMIERTYVGTVITTNLWNRIDTNTSYQVASETNTVLTNVLFTVGTTGVTSQVYDKNTSLPYCYQFTEGDKIIFTWTYTNAPIYFIQTIELE